MLQVFTDQLPPKRVIVKRCQCIFCRLLFQDFFPGLLFGNIRDHQRKSFALVYSINRKDLHEHTDRLIAFLDPDLRLASCLPQIEIPDFLPVLRVDDRILLQIYQNMGNRVKKEI